MKKFFPILSLAVFVLVENPALFAAGDVWTIESGPIDPTHYFGETVANGMLGVISSPHPFQTGSVLMQGVFDRRAGDVDVILQTFNVAHMSLAIDGVDVTQAQQVTQMLQTLDMRHAALTTTFDYQGKTSVRYTWYALRQLPHTVLVDVTVTAQRPIDIKAAVEPEAPPGRTCVEYIDRDFQDAGTPPVPLPMVAATAQSPSGLLILAASHAFLFDHNTENSQVRHEVGEHGAHAITFTKHLEAGVTYHFAAVGSTITSAQDENPRNEADRLTLRAVLAGHDTLVAQHNRAWDDLWRSDIVIEGDDEMQRDVHAMLYHLYAFTREGGAVSLSPMGLSGTGYNGHVFWDTETWMFPVLLAMHPEIAASLLEYRYERLGAARQNAIANGYRGAMFPWESSASGNEDTPMCCLTGVMEHHVTADVGIAAWQYYQVTHDKTWLEQRGWPLLQGSADFWASRVERNGSGHYDIAGIVGAAEAEKNISNEAYTNAAARDNLEAALAAAKVLGIAPNPDWAIVRNNIPILRFPNGIVRANSAYNDANVVVPEVVFLAYPLHVLTDPEEIKRHMALSPASRESEQPGEAGSIFITLNARLGLPDQAYALFKTGYRAIERPPFGVLAEATTSDNVYFATGAGALLQAVIYGFGGLEITPSGIVQVPTRLPRQWKSLTLTNIGVAHKTYAVH